MCGRVCVCVCACGIVGEDNEILGRLETRLNNNNGTQMENVKILFLINFHN